MIEFAQDRLFLITLEFLVSSYNLQVSVCLGVKMTRIAWINYEIIDSITKKVFITIIQLEMAE